MWAMAGGSVRSFGLLAGAILALTALPASAGWLEESGLSFIDPPKAADSTPSPFSYLDISVVRDGTESALRMPLAPGDDARDSARFSRFVPYLSVGANLLGIIVDRVFDTEELFGEYRFLHVNPDPADAASTGLFRRDLDGPTLKGGINIRLP